MIVAIAGATAAYTLFLTSALAFHEHEHDHDEAQR